MIAFKATSVSLTKDLVLEIANELPRAPWAGAVRSLLAESARSLEGAEAFLQEAREYVGVSPDDSIEHDHARYERAQTELADRYRRHDDE